VLSRRWKTAAKYSECVSAGERSLIILVLLVLESSAEGFGEGVRTVMFKYVFVVKRCLVENQESFSRPKKSLPQNNT